MNNVSVRLIFDRKHVATKKHQAPVQLEVTLDKKRRFITTSVKLYSDQWSREGKVKNHPQALLFNQQLADTVSGIYSYANELSSKNTVLTFELLDRFMNRGASTDSFLDFMRRRIEERKVSETTKARQRCVLRALEDWGRIIVFADITPQVIKEYDEFAKSRCNKQASVYNYHKILKVFVREAYAEQLIPLDPYATIKLDRGFTMARKFLTQEELDRIEKREIENPSLRRVRDTFLFCCYTGLAYSDLVKFDFSQATMSNGMYRIRDVRKKTGTEYNISLMDKAMDILKQYSFKLPVISNQRYNSYLKVLGAFCEVKKPLTSHVARHTFATTVTMANGVRIEVISKMLGHTNIKTTQRYAQVCQKEVDNEFNRLNAIV